MSKQASTKKTSKERITWSVIIGEGDGVIILTGTATGGGDAAMKSAKARTEALNFLEAVDALPTVGKSGDVHHHAADAQLATAGKDKEPGKS